MEPLVSIIVPIYKVEKYLSGCIDSILSQTYKNIEVILVNDGSPDRCPEICEYYALKDSRVKVLHKQNGGLSDARNAGLDIAKGAYVGFIDSDDQISNVMFEVLVEKALKASADVVSCEATTNIYNLDVDIANIHRQQKSDIYLKDDILEYFFENESSAVWRRLYKKDLFDNIRFEVGAQNEDILATFYILSKCETYVKTASCLYYWNLEPMSLSRSPIKNLINPNKEILNIVQKKGLKKSVERAVKLRAIQFEYTTITRSLKFGFADKEIEEQFKNELPQYLSNFKKYYRDIRISRVYRLVDKIQIGIMIVNYPFYCIIYKIARKLYEKLK